MSLTPLEHRYIEMRRAGRILNPVPGHKVTTPYGIPGDWAAGHHTGEDHSCPQGTPVVAVTWGHVVGAGWGGYPHDWGSAYGIVLLIEQANGEHTYGYCHLSHTIARIGQAVIPGMVVGHSGNTGRSTGAHVHFECRPRNGGYGSDVNPIAVKQDRH